MTWDQWRRDNQEAWDQRVPVHLRSRFYDLPSFLAGRCTLPAFDRQLLGPLQDRRVAHLQCHFGQDTLSLARRGADVTGLDLSGAAIDAARDLARQVGLPARFVQGDVLEAAQRLEPPYELVYTSWGVLGWLPDLRPWARQVFELLEPGGALVLVEFHPFVWLYDGQFDGPLRHPWFNRGVISEVVSGTYAEPGADLQLQEHGWNHPLADILGSLLEAGLQLTTFREYDALPYDLFPDFERGPDGLFHPRRHRGALPLAFGLRAQRPFDR
jgi:SAM-dependent methyltransferase